MEQSRSDRKRNGGKEKATMQVGETITYVPMGSRGPKGEGLGRTLPARVVWIHPLWRFAVVERRTAFYNYRETIRLAPKRRKAT